MDRDELVFTIGKIDATLKNIIDRLELIHDTQKEQWVAIKKTDASLNRLKGWLAGISCATAAVVTALKIIVG